MGPPFVPLTLLDLVDWPPCPLELDLHQRQSMFLAPMPRERRVGNIAVSSLACLNTKMTKDFGDYA